MKNKIAFCIRIFSCFLLLFTISCKKSNDDNLKNKVKEITIEKTTLSSDSIVSGQGLAVFTELNRKIGTEKVTYTIKRNDATVFKTDTATYRLNWSPSNHVIGNYQLEVIVTDNNALVAKKEVSFSVVDPVFGVALLGSTKEDVLLLENKNNKVKPGVPFSLFSRYDVKVKNIEIVYFNRVGNYENLAYFFKNNKMIGGEAFLNKGDVIYKTFLEQKNLLTEGWFSHEPILAFESIHNQSAEELRMWLNNKDYDKLSTSVIDRKFVQRYRWNNGRDQAMLSIYGDFDQPSGAINLIYLDLNHYLIVL